MWTTAAVALALVAAGLAARLVFIKRRLRMLAESARTRKVVLVERRAESGISRYLDDIHIALNTMIGETEGSLTRDRDNLSRVETTLGSLREAVLMIDEDSVVGMANEAARNLLDGGNPIVGRRIEALLPGVAFLDYMKSVREGAKPGNAIIEIVKGTEPLWFEVTGAMIGEGNSQKLYLFVLHDITKLKALENMRTEFVANVSHELRTPVTVIRGFTDTLAEGGDSLTPEERARFLGKIQKNVTRLSSLLEDLLLLSRLEGRAPMLKLEKLPINGVVKEVCDNFRDRKAPGCELEVSLDPAAGDMALDHLRLTQVLDNLLENANRHARGMTHLTVRTASRGTSVICTVEDNGCGIPSADVPHIFERFYRVDKGRSRELGGTGLGLAIVKHIVMQHGGRVFVESVVGKGTTIGFELPVRDVRAD